VVVVAEEVVVVAVEEVVVVVVEVANKNIWKIITKIESSKEDSSLFNDNDKSK
jgi:hypothetical protein